jgi:hypothetical protein
MHYENWIFHNTKKSMDMLPILQDNSSWFPHGFSFQQTAILSSPSERLPISSPINGLRTQRDESGSFPSYPGSFRSVLRLPLILLLRFIFGFPDNILYIFLEFLIIISTSILSFYLSIEISCQFCEKILHKFLEISFIYVACSIYIIIWSSVWP